MRGKQITKPEELLEAALDRRSVEWESGRYSPAAIVVNFQFRIVMRMIEKGLYIHEAKRTSNPRWGAPILAQRTSGNRSD